MDGTICNRTARQYAIEFELPDDSQFLRVIVYDKSRQIGYANCIIGDTILSLDDIHVSANVPIRERCFIYRILQFVRLKPRSMNYRRRGVGTQLLLAVLQYAREHGMKEVKGQIMQDDQNHNPGLTNWYRRHGFVVSESGKILLKLR